jgi:hypothetical protein
MTIQLVKLEVVLESQADKTDQIPEMQKDINALHHKYRDLDKKIT